MDNDSSHIRVAVALPVYKTYTYSVPEPLFERVAVGKRVFVPFGRRRVTGYVLGVAGTPDAVDIKPILDVLDDEVLYPPALIPLFEWISEYYIHPIGEVIQAALPGGINLKEKSCLTITDDGFRALAGTILTPEERKLLEHLADGPIGRKEFITALKDDRSAISVDAMQRRGWITVQYVVKGGRVRSKTERFAALTGRSLPAGKLSIARLKILEALQEYGEVSIRSLKKHAPSAATILKALEKSGHVKLFYKEIYRDPFGEPVAPDTPLELNRDQQRVVERIIGSLQSGFCTYLLAGVTGSGKTEVYMHVAAEVIKRGLPVLVLVPEIALISQMERRFRARFGDQVALLHSGLSDGERFDQWLRVARGQATVAIGARSAIFAPFSKIGLLIVDEEHDTSYKQEGRLRYNARDLAMVRARLDNGIALLGSATPSVQSYHNALQGKFSQVHLPERVEQRTLPDIQVVDLRKTRDLRGIRRFITPELQGAIQQTIERGEQTLLFLNRRGFANFPVCAACGEAIRCKNCDISLTLHQAANAYRCHYCGHSRPSVSSCDNCGSDRIKHLGYGTEKIADALKKMFPDHHVARMDRDTTARKGAIIKILKDLRQKKIDILVGTQMVAKGHDFPGITLVGIICADLSLSFPDFRAGERTFQLLAQVSGRAGRGDRPGQVVLQTYNPTHFCIHAARNQDFREFYKNDIIFRKSLKYPPYSRLIQLKISGPNKGRTADLAARLGELCRDLRHTVPEFKTSIEILGPIEAALARIAKRHRWQILLKGTAAGPLHRYIRILMNDHAAVFGHSRIRVAIDVDPFFMM